MNRDTSPTDSCFDVQQSRPAPGTTSSLLGSTQPENQASRLGYNYSPSTSQGTSSVAISYPVIDRQPSGGIPYRSTSASAWSEYDTPVPILMNKLLIQAVVPTMYQPTTNPDSELQWRDFSVADSTNIGRRNNGVGLGDIGGGGPSMFSSSSAILSPYSFFTDYPAPPVQQPVLASFTPFKNVTFQDHDEGTTSYSTQFAARRSRIY